MSRSEATLEELFALLPDLEELELLRLVLVGVAVPDPGKEWDSSRAYATVDKRVVSVAQLEGAVTEAEESLHKYLSALFDRIRPLFRSFWNGDSSTVARHLIDLGELQEESGLFRKARQCYDVALSLALPLPDKGPQILALRRIGRIALSLGDLQDAHSYYQRSAELARDSGDDRNEIIARTGLGNVRLWQGRWPEAENCYRTALALVERAEVASAVLLERAQLYNNLGTVATRRMHLGEAEEWFARARELWAEIPSPFDLAVCFHNMGHLLLAQGRGADARAVYQQALALPIPPSLSAGVAIDIAESCLRDGLISQAGDWGRLAEEKAISARSPYYLGRMYQGRGNIARACRDDDGFIFYEKALQIAREKGYPLLEGETLMDYAILRILTRGTEEAVAYLERAREIFIEVGAVHEQARAATALRELQGGHEIAAATR